MSSFEASAHRGFLESLRRDRSKRVYEVILDLYRLILLLFLLLLVSACIVEDSAIDYVDDDDDDDDDDDWRKTKRPRERLVYTWSARAAAAACTAIVVATILLQYCITRARAQALYMASIYISGRCARTAIKARAENIAYITRSRASSCATMCIIRGVAVRTRDTSSPRIGARVPALLYYSGLRDYFSLIRELFGVRICIYYCDYDYDCRNIASL
ncbi:unnamed protein product [Trichogramma brassicae]|uniref:Uncharacterized protein n=1 Tax=Trichogramma brassicae TaxID=86971 RepID=A0A6H5IEB5_9HYME|nr:unnamed protein product [Trichogramma brassicae]